MKTYHLLTIATILMLFGACAPTYNPTPSNPALFKAKGEAKVSGSISGSAYSLQGSYAVTDHFAINSTINAFSNTYSIGSLEYTSKGTNWDIMPGYYTPLSGNGVFEVFGGLGLSKVDAEDFVGNFTKLYLQPSLGWAGDHFEGAFTLRLTELMIPETSLTEKENVFFMEPMATIRFGGPHLKAFTQLGVTIPPGYIDREVPVNFNPLLINIGLQIHIGN